MKYIANNREIVIVTDEEQYREIEERNAAAEIG